MRKKAIVLTSLLLSLIIMLGACSSGEIQETTQATDPAVTEENEETEAVAEETLPVNPAADKGNVFTYANVTPPGVFNGVLYTDLYDNYICSLVFDRLITYEPETMNFTGKMAESFNPDFDNNTIEFTLRPGIKIHNDLGEMTAEDVAFTIKIICDPEYDGKHFPLYANIIGAGDYKAGNAEIIEGIVLHTEKPENPLPVTYEPSENNPLKITLRYNDLSMSNMHVFANYGYILPRAYYEQPTYAEFKALNNKPAGTGPYVFNRYLAEEYIEMDKFEDYWQGSPKIDKVFYQFLTYDNIIPSLLNGTIDLAEIRNIDHDLNQIDDAAAPHLDMISTQGANFAFIEFRCNDPVMSDVRVRQALTFGFDREQFIDTYFSGKANLAYAVVPRTSSAYPDEDLLISYDYDPDKAGELLDEAGWLMADDGWRYKDGEKLAVHYTGIADNANDSMKTEKMAEEYKLIGVELVPGFHDWEIYMDLVKTDPETQMFGYAWTMNPDPYVSSTLLRSDSINNDGNYNNPEFDRLCNEARYAKSLEEAARLYQEAYLIINEEVPMIFMNDYTTISAYNKRVEGLLIDTFLPWTYNIVNMEIKP